MIKLITIDHVRDMVKKIGILKFFQKTIDQLAEDHRRWQEFEKVPRIATHRPFGVYELMPICDEQFYTYKYVNGHPKNPSKNKMTVVAMGMLADMSTGYPLLISEMTLLTAFRTAATCALAAKYLARKDSKTVAMIGTGAQGEFQLLAHHVVTDIAKVKYFDIDTKAMEKFASHLAQFKFDLIPCQNVTEAVADADIVITATADKKRARILHNSMVKPGMHLNGVGGDCPGKTELDPEILNRSKVVVEYLEQAKIEGETQHISPKEVHAELWELVQGKKPGREKDDEITLFDSVGFALQDYSILKLIHQLADEMNVGEEINLIPQISNPKNLFSCLE